jgi:alpha-1,3/alpha-1,6-mannosyltransferase
MYRLPFDWVEGATTGLSDAIVVNSLFTKSVFKDAFPGIDKVPDVIYPCVDVKASAESPPEGNPLISFLRCVYDREVLILGHET